jgi:selenocysteine lyase/cysteine desulfurase
MPYLNRRGFLRGAGIFSATAFLSSLWQPSWSQSLHKALDKADGMAPSQLAGNEDFWQYIRQAYTVSDNIIYLNAGGVSPQPRTVQETFEFYNRFSNQGPAFYMWQELDRGREPLRLRLADMAGCSSEEIAINRNTTEALATVIFGLPLQRGDEVVLSKQDYPNMINAWKQRELRDGIKLVWVNLTLPSEDDTYLTQQYTNAFTARTKLVQITHLINWNGQILPVRKIADAAHARGIEVLVDGAHTFAHFDYKIPELGADYFGTSLHKWLCAPFGSGMLYIRKEKISKIYPLLSAPDPLGKDIHKFENLGTRSFPAEMAIGKAIEFHEMIGAERKQERLHYLKNYWMQRVQDIPGVQLHTSFKPAYGCAVGMLSVKGRKPAELHEFLMTRYKIYTVAIEWENINGVRVTPNVYTSLKQLDLFVQAVKEFAGQEGLG